MSKISIIIPSYNSYSTISYTIDNIISQSAYEMIEEVIIVDSSDDGKTKEYLQDIPDKKFRLVTSGVRVMPAIQRNIGAKEAKTELLAFVDSDAYPEHDWVKCILEAYSNGIKVGGGSYRVPEFQLDDKVALAQYYLQFNEYLDTHNSRKVMFTPSCNLFCDKALFEKTGGFPEIRASEDTMFGLSVSKIEQMTFVPGAIVYHIFRTEEKPFLNNQVLLGEYVFLYRRKYYHSFMYRSIMPYLLLPAIMFVKIHRINKRVYVAGTEHKKLFRSCRKKFYRGLRYWRKGFVKGIGEYRKVGLS